MNFIPVKFILGAIVFMVPGSLVLGCIYLAMRKQEWFKTLQQKIKSYLKKETVTNATI